MGQLTHLDDEGRASMVDVSGKRPQLRVARACGRIRLAEETLALIRECRTPKGNVLSVAQIAGIQAAKQTHHLIPLCHPLPLTKVAVELRLEDLGVFVESSVVCTGRTGVEMEALTAVSVALLTVYDMCKAVDKRMEIGDIRLVDKTKTDLPGDEAT